MISTSLALTSASDAVSDSHRISLRRVEVLRAPRSLDGKSASISWLFALHGGDVAPPLDYCTHRG